MSDLESQVPEKPVRKRRTVAASSPEEPPAAPKRVARKKTEAVSAETAGEKPRAPRKTSVKKKPVEDAAQMPASPESPEAKPKRAYVRKKPVTAGEEPAVAPAAESPAPKRRATARKTVETSTEAEAAPTPPVRAKRVARKIAEEPSSAPEPRAESESAPRKTERRVKSPRNEEAAPGNEMPEPPAASAEDPRSRVRRVTVKRPGSLPESRGEDSQAVVERVSSLTDRTPVEGLPVKDANYRDNRNRRDRDMREGRDNRDGNRRQNGKFAQRDRRNNGPNSQNGPERRNNKFNKNNRNRNNYGERNERYNRDGAMQEQAPVEVGPPYEVNGLLELAPKGYGFLRTPDNDFDQTIGGVYVSPEIIRKNGLRSCQWLHGMAHNTNRGVQLCELISVNRLAPAEAKVLPHFEDLKAVNPNRRLSLETTPERYTTRVVDLMAPIGRGQRGLIVAPPRTGKTVLLQHMAEAVVEKYEEEIHLMILLIDERPEEVTEFKRGIKGAEVYASSNDGRVRDHCRLAELCIERAKRLVEAGKHVLLLMDSITRLARAYNNASSGNGRTMSGGIDARALEMPRRLFAAARNTRDAGSLTIIATALIETNSRMDDLIFQEFKGTGNMELVLNRRVAEQYIYPAVDILKSGTRREELILPELVLDKVNLIRRALAGHRPIEAMERLLFFLKKYPNNAQMLIDLKQRA